MSAATTASRVAVVHDWLTGMRGGEKVLEAMLELHPQAEIFTLFHDRGTVSPLIENRRIHTSSLSRLRRLAGDYRRLLPLFPAAAERWRFDTFDLVLSSSHCVAKGVIVPSRIPHLSYCHTPMRYIWDLFDDYFPPRRPLVRAVAKAFAPRLRRWDVRSSQRVDAFVANSRFVAQRIERIYGREAEVIHPFVDDRFLSAPLSVSRDDAHVMVSALVPYKKVELAVEAAVLAGRRLIVVGSGPLLRRFRATAPENVEFRGWASQDAIVEMLSSARSLLLPGVEDFGITPLEAMALGTPVVAYRDGGALETVSEGKTGVFFRAPTAEALAAAMLEVETKPWDRAVLRQHAARFSRSRFKEEFSGAVNRLVARKS